MFDIEAVTASVENLAVKQQVEIEAVECDFVVQFDGVRVGVPVTHISNMSPADAAQFVLRVVATARLKPN